MPEGKTVKTRVHLDVNVGAGLAGEQRRGAVRRRADELIELGAAQLPEDTENGEHRLVLHDIEGDEFCVQ